MVFKKSSFPTQSTEGVKRHIFVDVNSSHICANLDAQVKKVHHTRFGGAYVMFI